MNKNVPPKQEPLFPPDNPPMPGDVLTDKQNAEYDLLDAQGQLNAGEIRAKIGARALSSDSAPETAEPVTWLEESDLVDANGEKMVYEVAEPQRNEFGKAREPRSRQGLSGRQRLVADGPPPSKK